ncbi:MAG: ATP-binding protein [Methylococcaceae bacterium]
MDEIRNPFSPGAGTPPPELAGRNVLLDRVKILLARVREGRPEKSVLLVGLRGVGKTVLLNELEILAEQAGYKTILVEAHDSKSLSALLAPPLRKLLLSLDRMSNVSDKARRGLRVLKGFVNGVKLTVGDLEIGLDIEAEAGTADSGDLEADLPELFIAVAEAAQDRKIPVAILLDEIQYLSAKELSALIMAMHKMAQKRLPLVLIGAGLPVLPGLAGESKSYAERLFDFPELGPLLAVDAWHALRDPAQDEGADFTDEALDEIVRLTQGYPYFLQEWGYQSWNHAPHSPIQLADVQRATPRIIERLDANFFRVRFDRLTPREKDYLRALAELGAEPQRSGDIAAVLGVKVQAVAPLRDSLMKKGMIYSPAHGDTAFTVPLFDTFMKRAMPQLPTKGGKA